MGGIIMVVIRVTWQVLRGMSLFILISSIFTGVLVVSCLAQLFYGDRCSEVAGKLRLGS
jgi:hypothetical protein